MKAPAWLIIGVLVGLLGGMAYLWALTPRSYTSTYPPLMGTEYREDWIRMTAYAYALEGNRERTEIRLRNLPYDEIQQVLRQTVEDAVAAGRPLPTVRSLAELASHYQVESPSIEIYTGSGVSTPTAEAAPTFTATIPTHTPEATVPPPTATSTPTLTPSPRPTRRPPSPSPTVTATVPIRLPFQIISQTLTCSSSPTIAVSLVATYTVEVRGKELTELEGLATREVWLIWESGAERAITGLRPERGLGYADFTIEPGHTYNLYIDVATGAPVSSIQVEPCTEKEGGGWISRTLIILQAGD